MIPFKKDCVVRLMHKKDFLFALPNLSLWQFLRGYSGISRLVSMQPAGGHCAQAKTRFLFLQTNHHSKDSLLAPPLLSSAQSHNFLIFLLTYLSKIMHVRLTPEFQC